MSEQQVVRFAATSRVAVSLLAALSAWLVTPYDSSSRLLAGGKSVGALTGFANWDGVYYAHIARFGYEYEHFHAFFPFYPALVRLLSGALPLAPETAILVSGWFISNVSFVMAALYLYRLGVLVLPDERVARRAAYLFSVAPSSIFMSAVYSESLMCLLSFSGMYYLEKDSAASTTSRAVPSRKLIASAFLFGAASLTRSNGILLSLYIAWRRLLASPKPHTQPTLFLGYWLCTAMLGLAAIGPQITYFVAGIVRYCPSLVGSVLGTEQGTVEDRSWCKNVVPNISAMYVFVQREYWNVGVFRYYEWRQLPNFLLAAPMLALSVHSLASYFSDWWSRRKGLKKASSRRFGDAVAPYYVHWLFLLVNALLVVHIQVTTRLLAACPPLFWHPAALGFAGQDMQRTTRYGTVVVGYFLLFSVLGAVLFPTFYPWT